jgi:hypothetical protein
VPSQKYIAPHLVHLKKDCASSDSKVLHTGGQWDDKTEYGTKKIKN